VRLLYLVLRKHTNRQGDHTALLTDNRHQVGIFSKSS
jgi:hypothetical protein